RRSFLLGSAATLALTACGGSGSSKGSAGTAAAGGGPSSDVTVAGATGTAPRALGLIPRFAPETLITGAQPVPIRPGDVNRPPPPEQTPASLTARVVDTKGTVVAPTVTAQRHGDALQQPYYPFALSLAAPGNYELALTDSPDVKTAFDVSNPADVLI